VELSKKSDKAVYHSYQTGVPDRELNFFAGKAAQILLPVSNQHGKKKHIYLFFFPFLNVNRAF